MEVEAFLAQPLVARVAANSPTGPTVRPVWFLDEEGSFWWLTGSSYSRLGEWLADDPRVSLVVDTCDLDTGQVLAVTARGEATVHGMDAERASRKLAKYLGDDRARWPERFATVGESSGEGLVRLVPVKPPRLRDLSYPPPVAAPS